MRSLALAASLVLLCSSGAAETVKEILMKNYDAVSSAMRHRDLSSVKALLAPNYKAISPDGKSIGRADILKQFQFQANSVEDLTWPRKITSLELQNGTAVAVVSGHLSAYTTKKPRRHIELYASTKDTWKKIEGKWLLQSSRLLKSAMSMDGKPVNFGRR